MGPQNQFNKAWRFTNVGPSFFITIYDGGKWANILEWLLVIQPNTASRFKNVAHPVTITITAKKWIQAAYSTYLLQLLTFQNWARLLPSLFTKQYVGLHFWGQIIYSRVFLILWQDPLVT